LELLLTTARWRRVRAAASSAEQLAAAEVEIVATDALVRADLLPAQAHEPADSSVARSVGPP
jgi:hypothetical protein